MKRAPIPRPPLPGPVWRAAMAVGMLSLCAFAVPVADATPPPEGARLHVAPTGDDSADASETSPLRTPAGALQRIRALRRAGNAGAVRVQFAPGQYAVSETLEITPDIAGDSGILFAAPRGGAVWSGGVPVTGWQQEGRLRTAPLPESFRGQLPSCLFVGGRRVETSRYPAEGFLAASGVGPDPRRMLSCPPGDLPAVARPEGLELVYYHDWTTSRVGVERYEAEKGTLATADPIGSDAPILSPGYRGKPRRFTLHNAREFLTEGSWCAEGDQLWLWPPAGADAAAQVIAPGPSVLVRLAGKRNDPVRGVRFEGITLKHAAWPRPKHGFQGLQATFSRPEGNNGVYIPAPAAIRFEFATDCAFTGGGVVDSAGGGVFIGPGCSGVAVRGNRFERVGGNAISAGATDLKHLPEDCAVESNAVRDCGWRDWGAVGIWIGHANRMRVRTNRIERQPYTGISVGWTWGLQPTGTGGHLIEGNLIQDILLRMVDGGGIYTLGNQPGTVLRANLIRRIAASDILRDARLGIYLDEGSSDILVEGNVVESVANTSVNCHKADRLTIRSNYFPTRRANNLRQVAMRDANVSFVDNLEGTDVPAGPALADGGVRGTYLASGIQSPAPPEGVEEFPLTVVAYVRGVALPAGGRDPRRWILGKNGHDWVAGHYGLIASAGGVVGAVVTGPPGRGGDTPVLSPPGTLPADAKWHMLAAVFAGTELGLFLDGQPIARARVRNQRPPARGPLVLGGRPDNLRTFTYNEGIDEVFFFRGELGPTQLAEIDSAVRAGRPLPDPLRAALLLHEGFERESAPPPRRPWTVVAAEIEAGVPAVPDAAPPATRTP
jgi:hypothetical protein